MNANLASGQLGPPLGLQGHAMGRQAGHALQTNVASDGGDFVSALSGWNGQQTQMDVASDLVVPDAATLPTDSFYSSQAALLTGLIAPSPPAQSPQNDQPDLSLLLTQALAITEPSGPDSWLVSRGSSQDAMGNNSTVCIPNESPAGEVSWMAENAQMLDIAATHSGESPRLDNSKSARVGALLPNAQQGTEGISDFTAVEAGPADFFIALPVPTSALSQANAVLPRGNEIRTPPVPTLVRWAAKQGSEGQGSSGTVDTDLGNVASSGSDAAGSSLTREPMPHVRTSSLNAGLAANQAEKAKDNAVASMLPLPLLATRTARSEDHTENEFLSRQLVHAPAGSWKHPFVNVATPPDLDRLRENITSIETSVAETVSRWVTQGVQTAELRLQPFGNESVEVKISVKGNEAQVDFRTDHQEVRQVLEAATAQLKDMLGSEGLVLAGVSVGISGRQAQAAPDHPQTMPAQVSKPALTAESAPVPMRRVAPAGMVGRAVDLFV